MGRPEHRKNRPKGDRYGEFLKWVEEQGLMKFPEGSGSVQAIDEAPMLIEDLADYFAGLERSKLQGAWVACVVDAVAMESERPRAGELAKALMVVSRRLYEAPTPAGVLQGSRACAGGEAGAGLRPTDPEEWERVGRGDHRGPVATDGAGPRRVGASRVMSEREKSVKRAITKAAQERAARLRANVLGVMREEPGRWWRYQDLVERTGIELSQLRAIVGATSAAEWFEKRNEPRDERPRGLVGAGRVMVRERKGSG